MEFAFSDEQQLIRDSAEAFLADVSDSAAVRRAMATEQGYEGPVWQRICEEMVWPAIHVPEQFDGLGLGYVELVALLEQMGRRLLCAPYFSTVCLGVNALLVAGSESQKQLYLPRICAGQMTATLACSDDGQWDAESVTAQVKQQAGECRLDGELRFVPDGHTADLLIVAARSENSSGNEGVSLFVLPADTAGISRSWLPTLDQTRKLAVIVLDNVTVPASALLGEYGQEAGNLQKIIHLAAIASAAEQMGGAQHVLDMTVEYTSERVQFGRPVAGFQAIKHKAADMMLRCEVSRSAVYYAACVAEEALNGGPLGAELAEAASVAKAYCSDAFFRNAGEAIQMHGGVGFTWEYDVHLYFKRAKAAELMLGNGSYHRERIARLLLD